MISCITFFTNWSETNMHLKRLQLWFLRMWVLANRSVIYFIIHISFLFLLFIGFPSRRWLFSREKSKIGGVFKLFTLVLPLSHPLFLPQFFIYFFLHTNLSRYWNCSSFSLLVENALLFSGRQEVYAKREEKKPFMFSFFLTSLLKSHSLKSFFLNC